MTKVLKGISNIETYRGIPIGLEVLPDQNYYCMLGTTLVKSQLKDQLHSEIDKYLDNSKSSSFEFECRPVVICEIEYVDRSSDHIYYTVLPVHDADNDADLFKNAKKSLKDHIYNVLRVTSVRRKK